MTTLDDWEAIDWLSLVEWLLANWSWPWIFWIAWGVIVAFLAGAIFSRARLRLRAPETRGKNRT